MTYLALLLLLIAGIVVVVIIIILVVVAGCCLASGLLLLVRVPFIVLLLHRLAAHLHPLVIRRVSHPLLLPPLSSHAFAR
jgi:hypothetical protein